MELGRRRPDIPLLVVEGRGTSDSLARLPVDLSGLTNLNRMAKTPEPRDFYRLNRVVLMTSLCASRWAGWPWRRWPTASPCWPVTAAPCPRPWARPGSRSRSPNDTRRRTSRSRPRARRRPGWRRSNGCGTIPISKPGTAPGAKAEARRWDAGRLPERYEALFRTVGRSSRGD